MSWVVDTCLLIDVLEDDPSFIVRSASLLDEMAPDGLVICPITYVELAPAFLGDGRKQREFLDSVGVGFTCAWTYEDTQRAHKAWHQNTHLRRKHLAIKRPIADVLIGAFAQGHQGLLTRNANDFRRMFPTLPIRTP
jgi:predicted nucleic acid-binding protein